MTWLERVLWSAGLTSWILIALRQRRLILALRARVRAAEGKAFDYRAKLYGTADRPSQPSGFITLNTPRNDA